MASFDRYKQGLYGVTKDIFPSYDTQKAISTGDTIFLPSGSGLPADISDLKIVDGEFVIMTAEEKQAQADAWEDAQRLEVNDYVTRPDVQVDVLGAVVLEQINIVRAELGLSTLLLQDMKDRASEIALSKRGVEQDPYGI
jgi:hypothetical protein